MLYLSGSYPGSQAKQQCKITSLITLEFSVEPPDKATGEVCTDGALELSLRAPGSVWTRALETSLEEGVTWLVITYWNLGYHNDNLGSLVREVSLRSAILRDWELGEHRRSAILCAWEQVDEQQYATAFDWELDVLLS